MRKSSLGNGARCSLRSCAEPVKSLARVLFAAGRRSAFEQPDAWTNHPKEMRERQRAKPPLQEAIHVDKDTVMQARIDALSPMRTKLRRESRPQFHRGDGDMLPPWPRRRAAHAQAVRLCSVQDVAISLNLDRRTAQSECRRDLGGHGMALRPVEDTLKPTGATAIFAIKECGS